VATYKKLCQLCILTSCDTTVLRLLHLQGCWLLRTSIAKRAPRSCIPCWHRTHRTCSLSPPSLTMPPMVQYAHVAEPNAPAMNAAFDISSTVLATLSSAAQLTPLPFLQEASFLALAILNTVRVSDHPQYSYDSFLMAWICREPRITKSPSKPSRMMPVNWCRPSYACTKIWRKTA
jgi:hypothetical protein